MHESQLHELEVTVKNFDRLAACAVVLASLMASIPAALFVYDMALDEESYKVALWRPVLLVSIVFVQVFFTKNLIGTNSLSPSLSALRRSLSHLSDSTTRSERDSPISPMHRHPLKETGVSVEVDVEVEDCAVKAIELPAIELNLTEICVDHNSSKIIT